MLSALQAYLLSRSLASKTKVSGQGSFCSPHVCCLLGVLGCATHSPSGQRQLLAMAPAPEESCLTQGQVHTSD